MLRTSLSLAILTALISLTAAEVRGNEVQWLQSVDQARQIAGQSNRLVLVHFWSPTCEPCKRMEQSVYKQPGMAQRLQARFVPVKVNTQQYPVVAAQYGVTNLPCDVILAPNGQLVGKVDCSLEPARYINNLEQTAATADPRLNSPYDKLGAAGAQPSVAAPTAPPSGAPLAATQRYADYFNNRQATPPGPVAPPITPAYQPAPTATAGVPPQQPSYVTPAPMYNPKSLQAPTVSMPTGPSPNAAAPYGPLVPSQSVAPPVPAVIHPAASSVAAPAVQQPMVPTSVTPQVPATQGAGREVLNCGPAAPAGPPLALDGYCGVELAERERWVKGDARFGAIHRGQTYLFSSADHQKRFLANPDRYSPAMSGADPVVALDARQMVPGRRAHGLYYANRIYLFSSENSLETFCRDPKRYADGVRVAEAGAQSVIR